MPILPESRIRLVIQMNNDNLFKQHNIEWRTRMEILEVRTGSKKQFLEITDRVQRLLEEHDISEGLVSVFVPHTTAGVTINENADPDVVHDMLADLDRLVPEQETYYRHFEGNSASHLKASLMGQQVSVPVSGGRLALGRWQGLYFCEFDGPRSRKVIVSIVSSESRSSA